MEVFILSSLMRRLLISLACMACTLPADAALDANKLRLLSCDRSGAAGAARTEALAWLNASSETLPGDAGQRLVGPVRLGGACLQNVTVAGSFGVIVIQGEICNADLDEFTDALAAAGTRLDKDVAGKKMPGTVLGMADKERRYMVTRGMIDMRSGSVVPTSMAYAFTCTAAAGGAQ
jgi:hypothetical protein